MFIPAVSLTSRRWLNLVPVLLSAALSSCGSSGPESAPTPPAAPAWTAWTAPGAQPLQIDQSGFDYFLDSDQRLLAVESRRGTDNVVTVFTRRYVPATGWDSAVPLDVNPGNVCANARFAYRDGYLLGTAGGYLYFDKQAGWCRLPVLPAADGPATALMVTAAADSSVIGSRIVGTPATPSRLEVFELLANTWQLKSTRLINPVSPSPPVPNGFVTGAWFDATAYEFRDGIMAWAQFHLVPAAGCVAPLSASCGWLQTVELAGDGTSNTAAQGYPCILGISCYLWSVLPDNTLVGYLGRTSNYYRRASGAWRPSVNGESTAPGEDVKLDPVFVHSTRSAVFTTGCAAGVGFCEGEEFVRFVSDTGSVRSAQVSGLTGRLSASGSIAVLRTTGPWQIAYRLGVREYTEPRDFADSTFSPVGIIAGTTRQYVVFRAPDSMGRISISVSTRTFQ